MTYRQLKERMANPGEKAYYDHTYAINNQFGILAIVYATHEYEALDIAVDVGLMDSELMSDADHATYEANGWDDSFMRLGNASEPFWTEYLGITDITAPRHQ